MIKKFFQEKPEWVLASVGITIIIGIVIERTVSGGWQAFRINMLWLGIFFGLVLLASQPWRLYRKNPQE